MSVQPLYDATGRRRSTATTPGFRAGIAPRNKGQWSASELATPRDCFSSDSSVRDPARRECFRSQARSDRAPAMPRARTSRQKTRTIAFSGTCDRRPARDCVGDPRCCSQWGCNSGPQREPACEAIVGTGRHPSLLSSVSDRQIPVDGAVRLPRFR
jgi:hypothetical protein